MRKLFNDIINTEGVKGIILFSYSGEVIFKEFTDEKDEELASQDLKFFLESLDGVRETDLIFEKGRIYVRRTEIGYLVILMALFVPVAMVRLYCDILLPALKQTKPSRKFGKLFKK